jgi:phosphotriesterase-related protein
MQGKERAAMGVITVAGVIEAKKLGVTAAHEHIFCDYSKDYVEPPERIKKIFREQDIDLEHGVTLNNYGWLMREPLWSIDNQILSDFQDAKEELLILRKAGVRSVLDPTNIGVGRNPAALRRLSSELNMHFVTCTGYYRNKFHPPEVENLSIEEIEALMYQELMVGIGGTDIRAGVMGELGTTGEQIYPRERKVLVAAGRVNARTNAPIMIHTEGRREVVLEALAILKENGANLEKVHICHVNGASYWEDILKTGASIGMDCFGSNFNVDSELVILETDLKRIRDLKRVVDAGYARKVIVGNDVCMKMRLHKYGGWGYDHFITNLKPYMLKEGITEEQWHDLLVESPRCFLDLEQ